MSIEVEANEPRVLLTRDDGVIVAKYFSYLYDADNGMYDGVAAKNEDGGDTFFTAKSNPTWGDVFGIDLPDSASYSEKKLAIMNAAGWEFDEEFLWLKTDDNGDAIPGTDTEETLTEWLNSEIDPTASDYAESLYSGTFERTATEHTPGFILMAALTPEEQASLGLVETNIGGPASYLPCVRSEATIEELNAAIKSKGLPFLFVDDDGSMGDGSC